MSHIRINSYSNPPIKSTKSIKPSAKREHKVKYYVCQCNEKPVDWNKMKQNLKVLRDKGLISFGSIEFDSLELDLIDDL